MGAINYYTSNYITLGIKPYSELDFENDLEFMQELQEQVDEYGGTIENALYDYISECYACDWDNVQHELDKHNFYYYHIEIKPGYYEGFTLDIENNFPIAYDGWEDKQLANKEITEIKQLLIACAGLGLVECSPGWCTGYSDYNNTLKAINDAIKNMREEVKTIPTWNKYIKEAK